MSAYSYPYPGRPLTDPHALALNETLEELRGHALRAVQSAQDMGQRAVRRAQRTFRRTGEWRPSAREEPIPLYELDGDHQQAYLERIARDDHTPDHAAFSRLMRLSNYSDGLNAHAQRGRDLRQQTLNLMWDEWNKTDATFDRQQQHNHPNPFKPWIEFEGDARPVSSVYTYLSAATYLYDLQLVTGAKHFCDSLIAQEMQRNRRRTAAPLGFLYVPTQSQYRKTQLLIYPVGDEDDEMVWRAAWEWACLLGYHRLRGLHASGPGYPGDVKCLPDPTGDVNATPFIHEFAHALWWGGPACGEEQGCECVQVDLLRNARPFSHPDATGPLHPTPLPAGVQPLHPIPHNPPHGHPHTTGAPQRPSGGPRPINPSRPRVSRPDLGGDPPEHVLPIVRPQVDRDAVTTDPGSSGSWQRPPNPSRPKTIGDPQLHQQGVRGQTPLQGSLALGSLVDPDLPGQIAYDTTKPWAGEAGITPPFEQIVPPPLPPFPAQVPAPFPVKKPTPRPEHRPEDAS